MVAKTIGTRVSFAWETIAGQRPTTGYKQWCDARSHPDLNPEADQVETTTLCQTHNHTYEDGLVDFGTLEFGSNMTQETFDLFLGDNGYVTVYPQKNEQGLKLWACIHIKGIKQAYYIPVKPQAFGLPEGEAGSNAYELIVRFSVAGDAGWYDAPNYDDETVYSVTINGYVSNGVSIDVLNADGIVRTLTTSSATTTLQLAQGNYVVVARKDGQATQVKDLELNSDAQTVTFTEFTE